jgi:hypothetical protein
MKSSDGKTVFREVFVKGKSMRYFAGFHDFKAEAINQTYVPIVESKKALDCAGVPVTVNPNHFQERRNF